MKSNTVTIEMGHALPRVPRAANLVHIDNFTTYIMDRVSALTLETHRGQRHLRNLDKGWIRIGRGEGGMHDLPLLVDITAALLVAFFGGMLARRLGLPTIVGYLMAGIVIGPFTPGFVGTSARSSSAPSWASSS